MIQRSQVGLALAHRPRSRAFLLQGQLVQTPCPHMHHMADKLHAEATLDISLPLCDELPFAQTAAPCRDPFGEAHPSSPGRQTGHLPFLPEPVPDAKAPPSPAGASRAAERHHPAAQLPGRGPKQQQSPVGDGWQGFPPSPTGSLPAVLRMAAASPIRGSQQGTPPRRSHRRSQSPVPRPGQWPGATGLAGDPLAQLSRPQAEHGHAAAVISARAGMVLGAPAAPAGAGLQPRASLPHGGGSPHRGLSVAEALRAAGVCMVQAQELRMGRCVGSGSFGEVSILYHILDVYWGVQHDSSNHMLLQALLLHVLVS